MPKKKHIDDALVLEKALLVISDKGPDTFTLSDVGEAVGLAPATLLQRFGSKQNLLLLAAKQANATLKSDLEELKAKNLPREEELIALLCQMPEGFGSRQDIANSLGMLRLDMVDPTLHPIARKLFSQLRSRIQELLDNDEEKAWELDALRHGLVIQWTLSGKGSLQNWLKKGIKRYLDK